MLIKLYNIEETCRRSFMLSLQMLSVVAQDDFRIVPFFLIILHLAQSQVTRN